MANLLYLYLSTTIRVYDKVGDKDTLIQKVSKLP